MPSPAWTRGDRWRTAMREAMAQGGPPPFRTPVQRTADAGMALADQELAAQRAELLKLRDLRILLERQRDDATAIMRRALSEGVQHHRARALREAALEGLRILEREP